MGRPLNKKYFGNRNTGSASVTTDNGIGGQGVASVVLNAVGSYTTRPVFTFTDPQLPLGVTATGTFTSEALSAVVTTAGTGYVVGDLLTLTSAGGSAIAYVATVSTGAIATVNFTGTGASRGSFEALPGAKFPATLTGGRLCAGGSGTGAELTVTFRAKAVLIVEPGSGYTAAPTAATGPTQSVTFTSVALATDSGAIGSATNQENAIRITAWLPAVGAAGYISGAGGSQGLEGDIVRQRGSRSFTVVTTEGKGRVKLTTTTVTAGTASIEASDYNGNTYYVSKLSNHRATLTRWTQNGASAWVYATGDSAKWSFAAAVGTDKTISTTKVIIQNS